jgi:hypothetical protein
LRIDAFDIDIDKACKSGNLNFWVGPVVMLGWAATAFVPKPGRRF